MFKSVSHAVSTREFYITPKATGPRGDIGQGLLQHVIQILTGNIQFIKRRLKSVEFTVLFRVRLRQITIEKKK